MPRIIHSNNEFYFRKEVLWLYEDEENILSHLEIIVEVPEEIVPQMTSARRQSLALAVVQQETLPYSPQTYNFAASKPNGSVFTYTAVRKHSKDSLFAKVNWFVSLRSSNGQLLDFVKMEAPTSAGGKRK